MTLLQRSGFAPEATKTPVPQGTPAGSSSVEFYDSVYDISVAAAGWNDWVIEGRRFGENWTVENRTPSTCSISAFPDVARLAEGVAQIVIDNGAAKQAITLDFRTSGGSTFETITGYVADTVAEYLFDDGIARMTVEAGLNYFEAGCWLDGVDLTAVSFEGNRGFGFSANYPLTLITPQHAVAAKHVGAYPIGSTYRWKGATGTIHERTILNHCPAETGDAYFVVLSSPLPADVTPMAIAGPWVIQKYPGPFDDFRSYYLGGLAATLLPSKNVCAVLLNTVHRALPSSVLVTYVIGASPFAGALSSASCTTSTDSANCGLFTEDQERYFLPIVAGNSGSPVFTFANDTPALLWVWFSATNGTALLDGEDWVNACISATDGHAGISTGYTVTVAPDPTL